MGYACPVCEIPQHDAEHLANHLAMTALTHGDDHEAWLDDRVEGWAEESPDSLADRVAPLATEVDHETVFEDTTADHDHDHDPLVSPPDPDTEAARAAVEEARRMREAFETEDDDA